MATNIASELLTIDESDLDRNKNPRNANAMLFTDRPV